MSLLGNIIWILFGGFFIFLYYIIGGLALCLTIIGIPFGVQVIKLSYVALVPFGKEILVKERASGCLYILMNIIWLLLGGLCIAVTHILIGLLFGITIIGIPFAKQHFKLANLALSPFGRVIA